MLIHYAFPTGARFTTTNDAVGLDLGVAQGLNSCDQLRPQVQHLIATVQCAAIALEHIQPAGHA